MKLFDMLPQPCWSPDEPAAASPSSDPAPSGPAAEPGAPEGTATPPVAAPSGEASNAIADAGKSPEPSAWEDRTSDVVTGMLPEGFEATPEELSDIAGLINASKGDVNATVGSLLKYYADTMSKLEQQALADSEKLQTTMQAEIKSDPTFGGANYDTSVRVARETAERYGGDSFMQLLRATGAGNSLAMVRFLNEVAKALPAEGTPVQNGAPTATPKTLGQRLFPNG